ncbi:flagellar hook-basal body complex protein FliE [Sphingomonas jejuensis]|jgi:flagellar hook-basal body complex protein FliE|uniref:Flagellar hook-basal body complex protein FliE n=1 Tax=Sphingomonas jejuensis TaxID=904715 RepID=A0ABX0XNB4_9SPHN|nr:flagellar hook-basal body complex protein FliE [Sphingomonas jejuensis]NJC34725.1 flagellar hook-basal body complex protein FliE [Sphingomonas jejuensis]
MSISGIGGGGAMGVDRVMALRAQILERNEALQRANSVQPGGTAGVQPQAPREGGFAATMEAALAKVNDSQNAAQAASAAYERGETIDVARVMLARQEASIGFEATLQVRNKLLTAYKDIMSMPV